MNKLVILFKPATRSASFDMDFTRSLDLLNKMPGVQRIRTSAILGSPMGSPAYHQMVEVLFETFDALDSALTSPEGVVAGKHLIAFGGTDVDILFAEEQIPTFQPFTPEILQSYLDQQGIPAEIVRPGRPTPTVAAAAKALDVDQEQIVKSVLFLVNDRPFLALGCGQRRVDSRKIAARLNVEPRLVKLATAEEVQAITGYAVGTVPPFGFKAGRIPTFMDPDIQRFETVYAGGGGMDALLKITSADLLRVTNAEVLVMLHRPSASTPAPVQSPAAAPAELGSDTAPESTGPNPNTPDASAPKNDAPPNSEA